MRPRGMHAPADDFAGRLPGLPCGTEAWAMARRSFDSTVHGQG